MGRGIDREGFDVGSSGGLGNHLGEDCYLESFCREGIGVVWRRSEGLVKRLCAAESVMMCMLMQHVS